MLVNVSICPVIADLLASRRHRCLLCYRKCHVSLKFPWSFKVLRHNQATAGPSPVHLGYELPAPAVSCRAVDRPVSKRYGSSSLPGSTASPCKRA